MSVRAYDGCKPMATKNIIFPHPEDINEVPTSWYILLGKVVLKLSDGWVSDIDCLILFKCCGHFPNLK